MNRKIRVAAMVTGLVVAGVAAWWAWGPKDESGRALSGYVEGEPLYMSASTSGAVSRVSVRRGQRVVPGQPLFALDAGPLVAQRDRAAAVLAEAQARLDDARKGQRPQELAVFDAQRAAARAAYDQADAEYGRIAPLVRKGIYAPARLDAARAARDTAAANVRAIERQRQAGTLGARADAVLAAEAVVKQARDALAETQSLLDRTGPVAPAAARVEEVYFQDGEWAAANQSILSLVPDDRVRLRFFVPERTLSAYRVGQTVSFTCDGCAPGLTARIDYISPRPEFTPPVIYSRDSRERMVFLVEARPADPRGLNPGQPVDVAPAGARK